MLIHLTRGDDLHACIRDAVASAGIKTGIVTSGIGSLRKLHYHYIDATSDKPSDVFETIERPLELVSLQGIVLEGEPHLHLLATEAGHNAYAGHLEIGTEVQYLAEISVLEIEDMPLGRRSGQYGSVTHFEWLDGRESESTGG